MHEPWWMAITLVGLIVFHRPLVRTFWPGIKQMFINFGRWFLHKYGWAYILAAIPAAIVLLAGLFMLMFILCIAFMFGITLMQSITGGGGFGRRR